MATDPRIRYDIEARASGAAEVEKLAQEFEQLDGAFPEDLAAKVRGASQQLQALGQQQDAVETFTRIRTETEAARRGLEAAQAAAQKFGQEIGQAEAPTRAQAGQLQKLRDNVREAKDELIRQTQALEQARTGLTQFGISGDQVGQRSVALRQQIAAVRTEIQQLATAGTGATGFQQLVRDTDAARQRMEQTALAANELAVQLQAVQRPTDGEAAKLRELRAAADTARADFQRLQTATVEQGLALRQAGVNTERLTATTREAAAAQTQAAAAAQRGANAYAAQGAAATRAAQQQTVAATTVRQGLEGIAGQLRSIQALAATVLGGQLLSGTIGDIARTADAYANLEARIKLVTGEGAALQEAFDGVFDVALRTNSAVEGTGTLFTRIAQAGRDLGLTTAEASAQALQLTETINQAIQVSGGTAQAADAAVTQLIQALQSGVLRGEEFNSVMEQAPRLARALADGLGVTTGELRKLAEAGTLTSTTVINALRGQSAALQREFEQLPPTVGRALTTLSTEWTRYVGEVDRANGISRSAAEAIQSLARNLDAVGTALVGAGKAVAAYLAIDLAKSLYARAAAAAAAAAAQTQETTTTVAATRAVGANTAAVGANTAAKVANTAATAASTTANAASALAWGSVEKNIRLGGTAAADAATKTTALGTAFGVLRGGASAALGAIGGLPAVMLAVILNARELGTWIGESAAKMLGAKDRSNELAEADRRLAESSRLAAAAKAEQAQRAQQASDAALGLTATSKQLVAEFEELRKKGADVAEAMGKVEKSLNFSNLEGIRNSIAGLDALRQKGELTGEQVRDAITKGLNGIDLSNFKINALAAFDGSEQGAQRLRSALDAIQQESLRRVGTSVEELRTGFSKAFTSSINDVGALESSLTELGIGGEKASEVLSRALNKSTDAASTEEAVQAVIARISDLGESGKLTGNDLEESFVKAINKAIEFGDTDKDLKKVEDQIREIIRANPEMADSFDESLNRIKEKVQEISPELRQLQKDAKILGVEFKAASKEAVVGVEDTLRAYERQKAGGKATAGELQQAFVNLAKKAIEASGGQIPEWVKVEAAMRGVTVGTDAAGKAFVQMGTDAEGAFGRARKGAEDVVASLSSITDAARKAQGDLSVLGKNVDKDGFVTGSDGSRFTVNGQVNVPPGYTFDQEAFLRAQRSAVLSGLKAPDPADYYVAPPKGLDTTGIRMPDLPSFGAAKSGMAAPRTVNININGKSAGKVGVSSDKDASALESVLRQVGDAARSGGFPSAGAGSY